MTILRTLLWFVAAAAAMLGAVWLAERPGAVTAEFRGWRLDTSVGALAVGIVVLVLVCIGLWLLYRWIVGAPGALLEGWGDSRRRRGYRELTHGLAAVAEVEGRSVSDVAREAITALVEARRKDQRFRRLLEDNLARHQRLLDLLRDDQP